MSETVPGRWSAAEQEEIWARWRRGESFRAIGRHFGTHLHAVRRFVARTGGCRRPPPRRAEGVLTAAEREEVSRGLAAGESYRQVAARLGRAHTTISREVARNGGPTQYRAGAADAAAWRRAERPKPALLATRPVLRAVVEAKLALRWSPQQIAAWLRQAYPEGPEMRVSHETIYLSLFVQPRGALRRELARYLRTGRAMRCPRGARSGGGRGQLKDTVSIRERPAEVEDRAVPGHWEGDLVFGRGASAVGTLVERTTRYVALFPVPGGYKAPAMREALAAAVARVPDQLRRSLTWDQGKEVAEHVRLTVDTGLQVYFCDPRSPWQRGTNENTNGLLRQYLPKSADLKPLTQADLDAVAAELNGRPRETLGWQTPAARFLALAEAG
ncbi:IS30 family transposase [Gemmatimonadetes bacterium T265]|nr:IS30 family transposase [Gemmatimonadetes bacterium T265]